VTLQLVLQILDLRPGRDPQLGIEVRQRLVHQEDVRLAHDGAGERHALALAAGKLRGLAVQEIVKFDHRAARGARFSSWVDGIDRRTFSGKRMFS
jgi:hypothetical protein